MWGVLLDLAAVESGAEGHLSLGHGDLVVPVGVGVLGLNLVEEEDFTRERVEHDDGAGQLVRDAHVGCVDDRAERDAPCQVTDLWGDALVHVEPFFSSGVCLSSYTAALARMAKSQDEILVHAIAYEAKSHLVYICLLVNVLWKFPPQQSVYIITKKSTNVNNMLMKRMLY